MTTHPGGPLRFISLGLALLAGSLPLRAEQFGLFTYQVVGGATVEITDYPADATGPLVIPAVIAGKPVTSIGKRAFYACAGLTGVTIPSGVASIADSAFLDCTGLTNVSIPSSVTSVGINAFSGCIGLDSIDVEAGNPNYASDGGVLFNATKSTVVRYPAGKVGAYAIPFSATSIGSGAFAGSRGLTGVIIPSSVTSIAIAAFGSCTGLHSIDVEVGNPNYASEGGVLLNAARNTLLQCPGGKAGAYAIPSSVTSIGDIAFYGCVRLTGITIPSSVTSIGHQAFESCSGLTNLSIPSSLTSVGQLAFSYCTGLTNVFFEHGVTRIDDGMFYGCVRLTDIAIPSTVTSLGGFSGCTGLTSITIPSSVTSIDTLAFDGCTGLTNVTIPSSVTSIGTMAFGGCTGLTSVSIPSSVTNIDGHAFSGCTGLTSLSIPSSVTSIGGYAFWRCTGLSSVTIPSGLTSISNSAFRGCTGLTSITIPSSVTSIDSLAFDGCTGLTNVTIPSSVTSIEFAVFRGCTGLHTIDVEVGNTRYFSDGGVLFNATLSTLVRYPAAKVGEFAVPSSVTSIDHDAFSGCVGLTSVTIPMSVASIGFDAFHGCSALTSITIPSTVTFISSGAFSSCPSLESINVEVGNPNYASDGGVLFNATKTTLIQYPGGKVGAYTVPSTVTSIGNSAFSGCTALTSVTIPASVTSIGIVAFSSCLSLESINVETGNPQYTSDGGVLFNATKTTLIQYPGGKVGDYLVPSGVTSIGNSAFYGCTGLTSVTFPSSVTSIGNFAFFGCTGLTKVIFLGNTPSIVFGAFLETAGGLTIHFLSSRKGFTSPTWLGSPSAMIDEATYPAASWLLEHELWYDTDLDQDPNGDGVSLLMAYALDLDPRLNLQGSLPAPERVGNDLSLSFHATSAGITYRVETSTDLRTWTADGVTQSVPGADGRSTATVARDGPQRFLRLAIED